MTEKDPNIIKREYVKKRHAGCGRAKIVQTFLKRSEEQNASVNVLIAGLLRRTYLLRGFC